MLAELGDRNEVGIVENELDELGERERASRAGKSSSGCLSFTDPARIPCHDLILNFLQSFESFEGDFNLLIVVEKNDDVILVELIAVRAFVVST